MHWEMVRLGLFAIMYIFTVLWLFWTLIFKPYEWKELPIQYNDADVICEPFTDSRKLECCISGD